MTHDTPPGGPDYAALAQRYLELWQEQIARLAKDPGQLSALSAAWGKMASGLAQTAGPTHEGADRATASGPAPRDGGVDRPARDDGSDAVLARLDALERRLAALEGAARSGSS